MKDRIATSTRRLHERETPADRRNQLRYPKLFNTDARIRLMYTPKNVLTVGVEQF